MSTKPALYGLLAEFDSSERLVAAARQTRQAGYTRIDGLAPFAIHDLPDALDLPPTGVPLIFLVGGIIGCLSGFLMEVYASVWSFPINVGGRPLYSWPAFIPIAYELTILFAGLAGAFGMLALNGLPKPHHPLFNCPRFDLASQTRFFLLIESKDARFDPAQTREFLEALNPIEVTEVPA